jgi:hypothetical protein
VTSSDIRKQIIGAAGEAFVTYKLLKHEIDSAPMITDADADLVMYLPGTKVAATIQVNAQLVLVSTGGGGPLTSGWVFNPDCPADYLAVVDLSRDRAWLFTMNQARELAQQNPANGVWRLYWYRDEAVLKGNPRRESNMIRYRIDIVLDRLAARRSAESAD